MLNDRLAIMNSAATPHPQHRPSQLSVINSNYFQIQNL